MFGNTKKCSEYLLHLVHRRNGLKDIIQQHLSKRKTHPLDLSCFLVQKKHTKKTLTKCGNNYYYHIWLEFSY